MLVADILREKGSTVHSIGPEASILEAAKLLDEKRVGALLVRSNEGSVAGIVSERDLVLLIARRGGDAAAERVSAAMTPVTQLVTCTPADTIDRLMSVMTDRRVRHLPVLEGGRLAGIVSIGDVVKARIRETLAEVEAMAAYVRS
jgi:CBS domain-containing protein